jgi:hypothetical protein
MRFGAPQRFKAYGAGGVYEIVMPSAWRWNS